MIFIGIALLVACGLALIVGADAGSLVGLSQMQTAQVIPLVLILIIFAGGAFGRRHRVGQFLGSLVLGVGIFAIAGVTFAYRDELNGLVGRVASEFRPGIAVVDAQ